MMTAWAVNPENGACCMYSTPCAVPNGMVPAAGSECLPSAVCYPGETKIADDGCNECVCELDGAWACTDKLCEQCPEIICDLDCPNGFDKDADGCPVCACSGAGECIDGDKKISNDGCEKCVCFGGQWACTGGLCPECPELICDLECPGEYVTGPDGCLICACELKPVCDDGDKKKADDGCNTCVCAGGQWACTEKACVNQCPPAEPYLGSCIQLVVWTKNPGDDACCAYPNPCVAPTGLEIFYSEAQCKGDAGCNPGEHKIADDGCNQCTCDILGNWNCGKKACSADCNPPECELSCKEGYQSDSNGCLLCACNAPPECEDGDVKKLDDGCNKCVCTNGSWACTEKACNPPESGCYSDNDCDNGWKCTADDLCLPDPSCPMCDVCFGYCVPDKPQTCMATGCSGEVCAPEPMISVCLWLPEYECLALTQCGPYGDDDGCGWKPTNAYLDCLDALTNPGCKEDANCGDNEFCKIDPCFMPPCYGECKPKGGENKECYVGGCSGQICSDQEGVISTCEWQPWYSCFKLTSCEVQVDGDCGWTSSGKFDQCMELTGANKDTP